MVIVYDRYAEVALSWIKSTQAPRDWDWCCRTGQTNDSRGKRHFTIGYVRTAATANSKGFRNQCFPCPSSSFASRAKATMIKVPPI